MVVFRDVMVCYSATLERSSDGEPTEIDELMMDLLWSDPGKLPGRNQSPRGAGVLFGADVTDAFCELNGLACIVRSHEVKDSGYEWNYARCLTVFSAANYCG